MRITQKLVNWLLTEESCPNQNTIPYYVESILTQCLDQVLILIYIILKWNTKLGKVWTYNIRSTRTTDFFIVLSWNQSDYLAHTCTQSHPQFTQHLPTHMTVNTYATCLHVTFTRSQFHTHCEHASWISCYSTVEVFSFASIVDYKHRWWTNLVQN